MYAYIYHALCGKARRPSWAKEETQAPRPPSTSISYDVPKGVHICHMCECVSACLDLIMTDRVHVERIPSCVFPSALTNNNFAYEVEDCQKTR